MTSSQENSAGEQDGCVPNVAVREAGSSPASQLRTVEASKALTQEQLAWIAFVKREMRSDNMADLERAERSWPESIR
jgi:hypothetical protein